MTATPIPRTLAQTVYGDLDVTEIARPPKGRRPVVTSWVSHERAAEAYKRLRRHLQEGRQAYVVCPLVSESETIEARAAEQEAERLQQATSGSDVSTDGCDRPTGAPSWSSSSAAS
jgi:ATP-dependent DNA helicase RecG